MNTALSHAISFAKGQKQLANRLTELCEKRVYQSYINYWLKHSKKGIPPEYCLLIEQITNGAVLASDLRPDIYPPPSKRTISHKRRNVLGRNSHDIGKMGRGDV